MATKLKFSYIARDASGRELKGNIEADSEAEATGRLRQQQLSIVKLTKDGGGFKLSGDLFGNSAPRKASTADLCLFTRQLATMIGAGIPLLESFEILAEQAGDQNKGFGLGLQECADLVRGGTEISEAMTKFPKIFPEIYINMVKAGEASGQLDIILNRLADFLEATESLKREIKSAMTYPIISLILIFGIRCLELADGKYFDGFRDHHCFSDWLQISYAYLPGAENSRYHLAQNASVWSVIPKGCTQPICSNFWYTSVIRRSAASGIRNRCFNFR